jgi:hypothetical protein
MWGFEDVGMRKWEIESEVLEKCGRTIEQLNIRTIEHSNIRIKNN